MEQPSLLDAGPPATTADIATWGPSPQPPSWAAVTGLPASWWKFHVDHPTIAVDLARLARQLLRRGYTRLSIAMLWETLRYRYMLGARPDEPGPRFNNNHRAYYARHLMEAHAEFAGVFEVRDSQAEGEH